MADNVDITPGVGATVAADDVGGALHQRVKVEWGPDGTVNETDTANGKPFPVQHRVSDGTAWTYGSGALGTGTPRVTLATDSPGVTALGRAAMAASLPVVPASDMATSASVTFTPAATSHVASDCNGAAGEFATMGPSGGRVMITSASILINSGTAEVTTWRVYLYNITPPSATADDGAWDLPSGDQASFLGYVDLGTAADLGSTLYNEVHGISKQVKLAGTGIFAYLVNATTLTPAAVAHIVTLHAVVL